MDLKVSQVMKRDKLYYRPEGTSLEKARDFARAPDQKLPVVNKQFELKGSLPLRTLKSGLSTPMPVRTPMAFAGGAALGVGPDTSDQGGLARERPGVDVVVVDTAHGHSLRRCSIRLRWSENLSAAGHHCGNIATAQAPKIWSKPASMP